MAEKKESVQIKQTNNVLYDKKHRYMLILKELNILRNQTDTEVLNEGLPKVYAQEIKDIYTRVIVGLLEEGVTYQYVKDSVDSKKDLIRLYIDGNVYNCRNMDVREILEDRYDEVMNAEYNGPTFRDINKSRKNNEDPTSKNNLQSGDVTNLLLGIKDAIHKSKENHNDDANNSENFKNKVKADIEREIIQSYMPPKVYLNAEDERKQHKSKNKFRKFIFSLVFTILFLGLVAFGVLQIPGIKEKITTGWEKIINYNDKNTEDESEEITSEEITTPNQ